MTGSPDRRRRLQALALALPVAASLLALAARDLRPGPVRESACWILPNLRALVLPFDADCPLGAGDALRRVVDGERTVSLHDGAALREIASRADGRLLLQVEREGRSVAVALPVRETSRAERIARLAAAGAAACMLQGVALALLLRSTAPAALPLASFHGALSIVAVCAVAGRGSPAAALAALACTTLVPGLLLHLAFAFPSEARLRRELPAVVALPYAASAFLWVLGSVALWQTPALWPAFLTLLLAACAGAWTLLVLACAFRLRESDSALECVRARVVLLGSLLLPVVPVAALACRGGVEPRELPALYVWSCVATLPLPVALVVSRYNLFDLGLDARLAVARVLYLAASAAGIAVSAWGGAWLLDARDALPGAGGLLAAAFACALALEPLRARLPRLLESWILPRLPALRAARRALERRLPALEDEREILACAERALMAGVAARWGALFSAARDAPCLAHGFGPGAPPDAATARAAVSALGRARCLQVASAPRGGAALRALDAAGVALVAALESGGERVGLLLLGGPTSGAFYSGLETRFVAAVAARTGAALGRARARARRQTREREAAAGRLALALAHDTGKDLHWLRLLSRRLAAEPPASPRARRDAAMIAELSLELALSFERWLDQAASDPARASGEARLDDRVAAALRRLGERYGEGRVVDVIEPAARALRCPDAFGRALEQALDDALRAGTPDAPVRLAARVEGGWLCVRIEPGGAHDAGAVELPLRLDEHADGAPR